MWCSVAVARRRRAIGCAAAWAVACALLLVVVVVVVGAEATTATKKAEAAGSAVRAFAVRDGASGAWRRVDVDGLAPASLATAAAPLLPQGTKGACAWADYANTVNATGWATLTVHGNASCGYRDAASAMGFLEGHLSQPLIWDAFVNFNASNRYLKDGRLPGILQQFIDNQTSWMHQQAQEHAGSSLYWKHVHALLLQAKGVQEGYKAAAPANEWLSSAQVYMLAMSADLEDLSAAIPYINGTASAEWWKDAVPRDMRMDCSALVKVNADHTNLFTGHTTFNAYWAALRIFKHYVFAPHDAMPRSDMVSFSSRPGDLHSKDDFFLLSDNMTVVETSLSVFNKSLYRSLTPLSVPVWIRAQVANRLATSAKDWVDIFLQHNSGTHNCEWIVTDYKRFKPNRALAPNTTWMVDQMVHAVEAADVTPQLQEHGYVASFNLPAFKRIFDIAGFAKAGFNYTTYPRSQIFRRDHGKVYDLQSMCALMNSNDYKHDPLSKGNPCNQISARCDLPSVSGEASNGPYAFGGIDSKNVDMKLVGEQRVRAISGMPYDHVPPFAFTDKWSHVAHAGMPHEFKFNWTLMEPAAHITALGLMP